MDEYINRDAAIKATCFNCSERTICGGVCDDTDRLRSIPAAEVRPVRRGKWISENDGETIVRMTYGEPLESCRCSVCGEWLVGSNEYAVKGNFCPNCGADMREES